MVKRVTGFREGESFLWILFDMHPLFCMFSKLNIIDMYVIHLKNYKIYSVRMDFSLFRQLYHYLLNTLYMCMLNSQYCVAFVLRLPIFVSRFRKWRRKNTWIDLNCVILLLSKLSTVFKGALTLVSVWPWENKVVKIEWNK